MTSERNDVSIDRKVDVKGLDSLLFNETLNS